MVLVVTPSKRATPCWRWTTKLPASRSSKKPSAARALGRARRCGTRRPVTSVSESTATLASGRMKPLVMGADHDGHARRAGRRVEHRRVDPLIGQGPGEACRARTGGRAQHDGIALADEPRDPGGQARRVPRHWVEAAHRQRRHRGSLGDRGQRDDAGRAVTQQPLEGDVEPREGVLVPLLGTPGGRQCLGQRSLLVEQLDAPVPDPARLDEHDLGSPPEQIGHYPFARRRGTGATTPCRRIARPAPGAPTPRSPRAAVR